MSADQTTKFRTTKPCGGCGQHALHDQVACYSASGFKTYEWVPREHRRPNGTSCTFKADLRSK